ncbi:recombinase family protein [Bacillus sp. H1m]|uniref:recombinase family protein n=1 Tax=Bacillus sp. H1m TaxID=1397277 RepID=UPI00046883E9|nr:recombinase family protein [Bacillus sp. H1m]
MKNKYKVFFRRVSTASQDLAMQESADAIYRQQYLPNEIFIIDEEGVSANKLKFTERPQMMRLITMIQQKQVDTIYAFDRSRLFRDFYESNYFVSLCKKKNVRIFFTSSGNGHQQATNNTLLEGVLNIVGDAEGKNIARRTEEARRRYPPRKLGYIKQKETKNYIKDPAKQDILKQYFSDLVEITSYVELEELIQSYKRVLKTKADYLLKIARDPFYAGYDLSSGENQLTHVEPYLTLKQFQDLQMKKSIIMKYQEKIEFLKESNIYQPYCGKCQNPMHFHFDIVPETSWYSCSKKHTTVQISTKELSTIINHSIEKVIHNLDVDRLIADSRNSFQMITKPINAELIKLKKDKNKILENIILSGDDLRNWKVNPLYKKLSTVEATLESLLSQVATTKELLLDNEKVVELLRRYLSDCKEVNPFFLYSMLIKNLYIYQNEVNLEINKFDYVQDLHKQYFFKGGKILCD